MKRVEDLKPGDVLVQDGVRFIVKGTESLPDGKTAVFFEDMPATEEVAASFRKLTETTGGTSRLPPVRIEQQTEWQNSKLRQTLAHDCKEIMKSHLKGVGKMEARKWIYIAMALGGRLRGNMVPNKVYLLYGDGIDRTDHFAKMVYLEQLCPDCESLSCGFNRSGVCRFPLVHERKPRINDVDGCIDYDYREGET